MNCNTITGKNPRVFSDKIFQRWYILSFKMGTFTVSYQKWNFMTLYHCVRQDIWVGQNIKYIEFKEDGCCENIKFRWKQIWEVILGKKPCSTDKTKSKLFSVLIIDSSFNSICTKQYLKGLSIDL